MANPVSSNPAPRDPSEDPTETLNDLFVIGGGINGCGIARDAAGRGLSVALAEMGDLAQATSSASSKMFHGGLRYLEYGEVRLVREALAEREVLLNAMPHIAFPMRFVLPLSREMRFDADTPISKLLKYTMPWLKGQRPGWIIRIGLWMYDHLGKRKILPGTSGYDLADRPEGAPLKDMFKHALEYSDVWVDDARLVVLNAMDARDHGATVMVRTKVTSARRMADHWEIEISRLDGTQERLRAKALVNAGGPWVADIISGVIGENSRESVRLVRGSHIVVPRIAEHDKAYFLQGSDGRVIFFLPFQRDFTMIGTTEVTHETDPLGAEATFEEKRYLLDFANQYLKVPLTQADVVHSFAGVRPLYEDGAKSATAATREYVLSLDENGPPLLNVFGGKITTYRKLAEAALEKLGKFFTMTQPWTAEAMLPGGFTYGRDAEQITSLTMQYPFLSHDAADRLVHLYGRNAAAIFDDVVGATDMGRDFGHGLTEAELRYLVREEFAREVEDVIWRRTKLGLYLSAAEIAAIDDWMRQHVPLLVDQ
ncbi:glycerol-3-phosphate dehydrogenase [Celeribacter neptunius]|uniref:Glycerol-3-phosphate dehydrogenase n=1 Tax=Celeribacter neptunius TaxID=588602 RepID=A0A1I3LT72_9RHOB|nr:glycerol-3-phosphate dehydrogenase [Celeribacter neptunius]SFI87740.1 homodimeric glycerol 3-phosphate dehydrogenase (quinone) [Celeribacter neptunius]